MTPWTGIHQAPLSMEFSRQEYWSELPFPTPRDLPNPGIKPACPVSPALQPNSLPTESSGKNYFMVWRILGFPYYLSSNESACYAGDTSMGNMLPVTLNINNSIN